MDKPIIGVQRKHALRGLSEAQADPDPFRQFDAWLDDAFKASLPDPNAMTLSTVGADGQPAARVVLLKGFNHDGFVFHTNYESRKGRELTENPRAAACFWWSELDRQVRIEGTVQRLSNEESDAYFETRPRESQLAAWTSQQSRTLKDREELEQRFAEVTSRYKNKRVPRPPHWGGFRIRPTVIEFWQGRRQRLHDRLCYRRDAQGGWVRKRLSP
jgi:pyridoxamine 5'-phosphate oxidase